MVTSSEDALGELYAWDSTIDEMYELGVDHADFDEDEALEAYEEMIQVGARVEDAADAVLSLAAQLLTKHFDKFPHVHMNVVDVLLGLCAPSRPQAVRIHTVRSLLQIVKTTVKPPLVQACRDRIADKAASLLKRETSNVIIRHLMQLQNTLAGMNAAPKKNEAKKAEPKLKKEAVKTAPSGEQEKLKPQRDFEETQARRDEMRHEESKREKREERFRARAALSEQPTPDTKTRDVTIDREERRTRESRDVPDRQQRQPPSKERTPETKTRDATTDREERRTRESRDGPDRQQRQPEPSPRDRDEPNMRERRQSNTKESGNGCPPSSFIFVGGVPRDTTHNEIIKYLSCIDESITYSCVQIKFPNTGRSAGYAFVSLESTDHARKAIRHIQTTEFNGRKLIGDFARGPPCSTLQFVERNVSQRMHDADAVRFIDAEKLDASVWNKLNDTLQAYGSIEDLGNGRIRFRDTDSAKSVIRMHHFEIDGREFLPVYDPEEQAEIDSSRRRPRHDSRGEDDGGSRRGGLNRYGGSDQTGRHGSREESDRKRRRSSSIDREQRDKAPRRDHHDENTDRNRFPLHRDFDQARYGPSQPPANSHRQNGNEEKDQVKRRRDSAASSEHDHHGDHRGRREQPDRRGSDRHRSRSPLTAQGQVRSSKIDKPYGSRNRSRSPTARSPERHRDILEQSRPHASETRSASFKQDVRGREQHELYRPRRDSNHLPRTGSRGGSMEKRRSKSPGPRGRTNSPPRHTSVSDEHHEHKLRSRSPGNRNAAPGDRRPREDQGRESGQRAHDRSPRRLSPPDIQRTDGADDPPRRDLGDRNRHDHESSWFMKQSGVPHGDRRESRRKPDHKENGDISREDDRGRVDRRNSHPVKMSIYGTLPGSHRSPSPPRFQKREGDIRARSRSRDRADRPPRFNDQTREKIWPTPDVDLRRYGNGQIARNDNGDRPRSHDRTDERRNGHHSHRERSPQPNRFIPRENRKRDGHRRSRSPPRPLSGNPRKSRSRSPVQISEIHGSRDNSGNRGSRSDFDGRRNHTNDRREHRESGGDDRYRKDYQRREYRSRDDSRDQRREKTRSPQTDSRREPGHRSRSPSPLRPVIQEQRARSPSPVVCREEPVGEDKPHRESPRATQKATASAYEDIDECMVDYEEDDE